MKSKINKNEFFDRISKKHDIDVETIRTVYDAMVNELTDIVCEDRSLSLTGFGTFSLKSHKGHPVQFEAKTNKVEDYKVLKFTASDVLMLHIRANISGDNDNTKE